ncbi:ornithine cyclodeaminase family protein [Algihabitans albus]|uniref:ornithine cyclodeaminase family protein n=1 Tax=Algihabitans albus TaxID=2164067 RepID=UPI000E5D1304|nr:ornithine cyclodeaminase [Algihabitans albus]
MQIPLIDAAAVEDRLTWTAVADAIAAGHRGPKAEIGDLLLRRGTDACLNRAAWLDGVGLALKSVTVFPGNVARHPPLPSVQGVVVLFDDADGSVTALIDGPLVTKWKTAGDSVLGARLLARPESRRLLILGSGVVAASLIEAYREIFPDLREIAIWSRKPANAAKLAAAYPDDPVRVRAVEDLERTARQADIIACATMATAPILRGDWVGPGCHVDLIGAFRPDMREADDALIAKAELFVDSRETAIHDIGELAIPIAAGVISESDLRGDLHDLAGGGAGRSGPQAVTLYKNGGGAHLDLMTANLIAQVWKSRL